MAVPFDYPNFTTPTDWWVYNNTVTDYWFGHLMLLTILIVSYVAISKEKPQVAAAGSVFLTLSLALVLWWMGVAALTDVVVGVVLLAIVVVANIIGRRGF